MSIHTSSKCYVHSERHLALRGKCRRLDLDSAGNILAYTSSEILELGLLSQAEVDELRAMYSTWFEDAKHRFRELGNQAQVGLIEAYQAKFDQQF